MLLCGAWHCRRGSGRKKAIEKRTKHPHINREGGTSTGIEPMLEEQLGVHALITFDKKVSGIRRFHVTTQIGELNSKGPAHLLYKVPKAIQQLAKGKSGESIVLLEEMAITT